MDEVFRAMADPTRRALLDELFRQDGQTLSALAARFAMTRFGVMKHLKVLQEAGLVVVRRRGREKLHFLNPVPIRLVHDRWVSKYAEPWVASLSDLKTTLETNMEKGFRDLYQDHAGAAVGGDHQRRNEEQVHIWRPGHFGLGRPVPATSRALRTAGFWVRARTSRSTLRAAWCRP